MPTAAKEGSDLGCGDLGLGSRIRATNPALR